MATVTLEDRVSTGVSRAGRRLDRQVIGHGWSSCVTGIVTGDRESHSLIDYVSGVLFANSL